ncbi:unnamed protein product [Ambrosiozyma monospora]|uniref:Unnamed protein product n=1 Tax=Ambrosiozyma monospora TaxID=43982 RepID=A0A9W6Z6E5_AMBMO|nr:unnamed protein product [Ambrosiozyma monospora]
MDSRIKLGLDPLAKGFDMFRTDVTSKLNELKIFVTDSIREQQQIQILPVHEDDQQQQTQEQLVTEIKRLKDALHQRDLEIKELNHTDDMKAVLHVPVTKSFQSLYSFYTWFDTEVAPYFLSDNGKFINRKLEQFIRPRERAGSATRYRRAYFHLKNSKNPKSSMKKHCGRIERLFLKDLPRLRKNGPNNRSGTVSFSDWLKMTDKQKDELEKIKKRA